MFFKKISIIFCSLVFIFSGMVHAQVNVTIGSSDLSKTRVVYLPIITALGTSRKIASEVGLTVYRDLKSTDMLSFINYKSNIKEFRYNEEFSYDDWSILNVKLVIGSSLDEVDGKNIYTVNIWDISKKRIIFNKSWELNADLRTTSHVIADDIFSAISGQKGFFNSKIAYIAEIGNERNKKMSLAVMDYDGYNLKYLTVPGRLLFSPSFSSDGKKLIFTAVSSRSTGIFLYDLEKDEYEKLDLKLNGVTTGAKISPNGKDIAFTFSNNGISNIYSYNIRNKNVKKLTNSGSIDTSPSYSSDGKFLVYLSDKTGNPQLYVKSLENGSEKRISKGNGSYLSPSWSPNGKWVAFIKILKNEFYLGIMRPDGSGEKLLAKDWRIETPSWSPNSQVITFYRQNKGRGAESKIYSINIVTGKITKLRTPTDATDPAWFVKR